MRPVLTRAITTLLFFPAGAPLAADRVPAAEATALARLPVREVTAFKDGHAFVVREGEAQVGPGGEVSIDELPAPILGAFWPFARGEGVRLEAVTADRRRVRVTRTALNTRELIAANPGAALSLTDVNGTRFEGTLVGVPERSGEELEAASPPGGGDRLPERGTVLLLRTADGVLSLALDQVRHVSFRDPYRTDLASEELRGLLTLKLAGAGAGRAAVGMAYVQKGLRWLPSYRVAIDGAGGARVKLQATLVNDLTDLDDVTANLVVGVPSFAFHGELDPMALEAALARVAPELGPGSPGAFALSNAMMSQVAGFSAGADTDARAGGAAPGPAVERGARDEDLFVFTLGHVTLRKGARMVVPIADYALRYRDLYKVDLPFSPPSELAVNLAEPQQAEMQRLLAGPKARHILRLTNGGEHPLTTAPALIASGERVLGQGIMTYTALGADTDLELTTAVDLRVKAKDVEKGRVPNALTLGSTTYGRVDLAGRITIENRREEAVDLEVSRQVLGHVGQADSGGGAEMLGPYEGGGGRPPTPDWWRWIPWPGWWSSVNGIGQFSWKVQLEPGKTATLGCTWHYFWP